MSTVVGDPASASALLQPLSLPLSQLQPLSGIWQHIHLISSAWFSPLLPTNVNLSYIAASLPLLEELALAGPRITKKFGTFITTGEDDIQILSSNYFTDADSAASFLIETNHMSVMKAALAPNAEIRVSAFTTDSAAATSTATAQSDSAGAVGKMASDGFRSLGGILSFAFSKWAISSVAMTIIMNRTNVYARTRRRIRLSLLSRLVLRLPPILLLSYQTLNILRSIQCQTSPNFSELRWGNSTQSSDLMFAFNLPFLNWLSSSVLLGASDRDSCLAIRMIPSEAYYQAGYTPPSLHGSLSLLWPVFLSICVSWFVDCLSCAMEGRLSGTETGMSLLETSLAFSEAEGAISGQISWDKLSQTKASVSATAATAGMVSESRDSTGFVLTRAMILNRVNTSPEMLVVALLACLGHITSNVLGIFNFQARYRLANTGVWAVCFMAMLVSSWCAFSFDDITSQSLLRLPTVCLLGWVPHMMLFAGMVGCILIYGLTVLLSTLSMDDDGTPAPLGTRVVAAMENMQARISLTELRVNGQVDFYTALLRIGFAAVSLASEAVYLQEDRRVGLKPYTWLEEKRLQEFQSISPARRPLSALDIRYDDVGTVGLIPVEYDATLPVQVQNGYARQRSAQNVKNTAFPDKHKRDGIGATERRNKLLMAVDLLLTMFHLVAAVFALSLLALLGAIGITWRPPVLVRISQSISIHKVHANDLKSTSSLKGMRGGTIAGIAIPLNEDVDVEAEVRRARATDSETNAFDENDLDRRLYRWWAKGGVWGKNDASGDYIPVDDEDDGVDRTSEISEDDDEDCAIEDFSEHDHASRIEKWRESSPVTDTPMDAAELARLLHPQTLEEREAARALSAHLSSNTIMTRSRFRRMEQIQRLRLLVPKEQRAILHWKNTLDAEEEERLLEALILSRRDIMARNGNNNESSWRDGGAGMGEDGPQCVVCQGMPRTIIVWPCRCLSLCDGCRIELAMKNYDKCVCCRREVGSFSRIFVP